MYVRDARVYLHMRVCMYPLYVQISAQRRVIVNIFCFSSVQFGKFWDSKS
jgi:hypothetical protein